MAVRERLLHCVRNDKESHCEALAVAVRERLLHCVRNDKENN
ncbi:hypothetical protein [Sulfurimonas sp.]|nr:hypothetical protein [Sulfurimonas sp.]